MLTQRYRDAAQARYAVRTAIKTGALEPLALRHCHWCNEPATEYDQFRGYDFPLDVVPSCHRCNAIGWHGNNTRTRRR